MAVLWPSLILLLVLPGDCGGGVLLILFGRFRGVQRYGRRRSFALVSNPWWMWMCWLLL